jgi:hypothetical protein
MTQERAAARSYAEWDRLVDEWLASGEKQEEFSKSHGINPKTFQGRVCQSRKRRGLSSKSKEVPYHVVEVSPSSPVESPVVGGECRITMRETQIEFSSTSETSWIGEVLSRLGHER